jgi:L-idonate 5-dehydrogenase
MHYFEHGYCAAFVPDRPFVLGHELSAVVVSVADDVNAIGVGERVTVNPARACGTCEYCKAGRGNLCRSTIVIGSASTTPPTDGALAEFVLVRSDQCHALPSEIDDRLGAMIEPLAVAMHAVKRAGAVSGKRALVTGAGTIGLLVALVAKAFGAVPVAVSDMIPARRSKAHELGADVALDPASDDFSDQVRTLTGEGFDFIFEASGSSRALHRAFHLVRPGGTIVQIGTLGTEDTPLPANLIMNKEINFIGSMRYGNVFDEAIRLVSAGRINLRPLINEEFSLDDAVKAFEFASDKTRSLKVQIQL